jgi:hypothetical protein
MSSTINEASPLDTVRRQQEAGVALTTQGRFNEATQNLAGAQEIATGLAFPIDPDTQEATEGPVDAQRALADVEIFVSSRSSRYEL